MPTDRETNADRHNQDMSPEAKELGFRLWLVITKEPNLTPEELANKVQTIYRALQVDKDLGSMLEELRNAGDQVAIKITEYAKGNMVAP